MLPLAQQCVLVCLDGRRVCSGQSRFLPFFCIIWTIEWQWHGFLLFISFLRRQNRLMLLLIIHSIGADRILTVFRAVCVPQQASAVLFEAVRDSW